MTELTQPEGSDRRRSRKNEVLEIKVVSSFHEALKKIQETREYAEARGLTPEEVEALYQEALIEGE
jgi:hypothetical protein